MPDATPPDSSDPVEGDFLASRAPRAPEIAARRALGRLVDAAIAASLLAALAPTLLLLWVLVSLDGGPGLVGERRIGRRGRAFRRLSLRTRSPGTGPADRRHHAAGASAMVASWTAASRLDGAARTTTVGRFLRATMLDALPQLFHVVTGDMALSDVCRR